MSYRLTTDKTWTATYNDLADTMRKWSVSKWTVENSLLPRSRAKQYQTLQECTVTLRYKKAGVDVQLVMDKQTRAVDNFRALYLAVEDMRMIDQRGLTDVVRQAYAQLPPPVEQNAYRIIGARPDWTLEQVETAYKARARQVHPDSGGDSAAMAELNSAMEQIRKERG